MSYGTRTSSWRVCLCGLQLSMAHFLLFCGVAWQVYKEQIDEFGSLQLLPEWPCSPDQGVQGSVQQHLDGLDES